ncbi:MAG: FHA domain-containing protein [Lachnospiraceae bacterium]|nr:FHA domain-containing protein [Lachnospiraceae bacterium]
MESKKVHIKSFYCGLLIATLLKLVIHGAVYLNMPFFIIGKRFLFINATDFLITVIWLTIHLLKWVDVYSDVCIDKQHNNAVVDYVINIFTFMIYGLFWIKRKEEKIKGKALEYNGTVNVSRIHYSYILWFVFCVIMTVYTIAYGTNITSMDKYSNYYIVISVMEIVSHIFITIFALQMVGVLDELCSLRESFNVELVNEEPESEEPESEEPEDEEPEDEEPEDEEPEDEEPEDEQQEKEETEKKLYVLNCIEGEYVGVEFPLEEDSFLMLGRDSTRANIVFSNLSVSGLHCQIRYSIDDKCFQVVDFSTYGTLVNGEKIPPQDLVNCPVGSIVDLGGTGNLIRLDEVN